MSRIDIYLLNDLKNTIEETNITKPATYQKFLKEINQKFKNLPKNYEIFTLDKKNKEIIINNEENYQLIEDILFIREIDINNRNDIYNLLEKSSIDTNNIELSESKKDIEDEKYNCILCSITIKNENPYFCYICQKIFHEKCLKDWDNKCKLNNNILLCPNCRNELPIEKWNKKLDYEDNRKDNENLIIKINEYKLKNSKINELLKKYENYINQTINIFKNILNQINLIHISLKLKSNNKLNDLINKYPLKIENLNIDDISKVIKNELNNFIIHIKNNNDNENNQIINKISTDKRIVKNNSLNSINNIKEKLQEKDEYRNKINIIYHTKLEGLKNIFGEKFVMNNRNNIKLIIKGEEIQLVNKYKLEKGNNIITILIKNTLKDLSYMFYKCICLADFKEFKYLDITEVKDFSNMFYKCSKLSNIQPLQKWNVSNVINFEGMFCGCSALLDIKPLQNWNVSKSNNFSYFFFECSKITDIKPLKNWNVLNCKNFRDMFTGCSLLSDIKPLQSWNVSNGIIFEGIFSECSVLSDIKPLQNWNVSNGINFSYMFWKCSSLVDIKPIKNWNVSNGINFKNMFSGCSDSLDVELLKWNISKEKLKEIK